MKKGHYIFVAAGVVVVVLAVAVFLWHPWSGSPSATPQAAAPAIPQVPPMPIGYSAKLTPTTLTIAMPQKQTPVVITAKQVTAVHRDAIAAAISAIQATAAASTTPVTPSAGTGIASSSVGRGAGASQRQDVATSTTSTLASIPDYLQELAQQMGFMPLSTSYTILFGKKKVYFAAKGMPNAGNQGKLSVFSYDPVTGLTQIAVLPDAGLQAVSDIALSPSEQYLVFFQCNPPAPGAGCYQLSYGFVVFDLNAKTSVVMVGAAPTSSPQDLYSFGQWFSDTSFSYHSYQLTATGTGSDVVQLGDNTYAPAGDQTVDIP